MTLDRIEPGVDLLDERRAAPNPLEVLRRERDRDVAAVERDVPCTCQSAKASVGTRGGSLTSIDTPGCWLHDEAARERYLRVVRCENDACEADELAFRVDGAGWCRVCQVTCIYCRARPAPVGDEEPVCDRCLVVREARAVARAAGETLPSIECAGCRRWIHPDADDLPHGGHASGCAMGSR